MDDGVAVTVTVFCSPCWVVTLLTGAGVAVVMLVYTCVAGIWVVVYVLSSVCSEVMVVVVGDG